MEVDEVAEGQSPEKRERNKNHGDILDTGRRKRLQRRKKEYWPLREISRQVSVPAAKGCKRFQEGGLHVHISWFTCRHSLCFLLADGKLLRQDPGLHLAQQLEQMPSKRSTKRK